ncbi:MAG: aminoglycoside phosphotransferase family protein [Solirubrobacteraceae bacterium]
MPVDLSDATARAELVAREWGLELGEPFAFAHHSYAAPAGADVVLKVAWEGDDESLHDADALALWAGRGAVRVLRHDAERHALLLERARPGSDISDLPDEQAMAVAVELGHELWQPAGAPFRWIGDQVPRWLDRAERAGGPAERCLLPLARRLYDELKPGRDWLVHGDFHHHNVLRHEGRYVAIDPKPYLADREYDVYPWLHNPMPYRLTDRARTERRIAAFVDAGLDDHRIRAWAVIRGAYLIGDAEAAAVLRSLLD